jgi:hypothetical protein
MSKTSRSLFWIVILLLLTSSVQAEEISTRRYKLPAYGAMELDFPKSWTDEISQPPDNLPPVITLRFGSGDEIAAMVTPFWNLVGATDFNSDKHIKDCAAREWQTLASNAVEKELTLNAIEGAHANGYYFAATDKAYKRKAHQPGEYEFMTRALMGSGDLLVEFTILSHEKESKQVSAALAMARTLRQTKFASPNHEQKMWALAMCAILMESNGDRHDLLGGVKRTEGNISPLKKSLREWWGIENRKDLFETLLWLQTGGHREDFNQIGAYVTALSPEELKHLRQEAKGDPELLNKIDIAGKNYTALGDKSILAWDYDRYISLCGWGYVMGYLSEEEAWEMIMPVAVMLQEKFDSWEDLGSNHLLGRNFWSLEQTKKHGVLTHRAYEKLCTDPASPWRRIPWNLDLKRQVGDIEEGGGVQ